MAEQELIDSLRPKDGQTMNSKKPVNQDWATRAIEQILDNLDNLCLLKKGVYYINVADLAEIVRKNLSIALDFTPTKHLMGRDWGKQNL